MTDPTTTVGRRATDGFERRYHAALSDVLRSVYSADPAALNQTIRDVAFRDLVCRTLGFEIANFHLYDPLKRRMDFFHVMLEEGVEMPWFRIEGWDGHGGFVVHDVNSENRERRRREQQERIAPGGEQLTADICRRLLSDQPERRSRREAGVDWLLIPEGEILTFALEYLLLTDHEGSSAESPGSAAVRCWDRIHDVQYYEYMAGRNERSLKKVRAWLTDVLADESNYEYLREKPYAWFIAERERLSRLLEPSKSDPCGLELISAIGEFVVKHAGHGRTDGTTTALAGFHRRSRVNPVMELIHGTHNIVFFKLTALVDASAAVAGPKEFDAYLLGTFFSRTKCEEYADEIQGLFRLLASRDLHRFALNNLSSAQGRLATSEAVMQTLSGSLFIHEMTSHLQFVSSLCQQLSREVARNPNAATLAPKLSMIAEKIEQSFRVIRVARLLAKAGAIHRDPAVQCNVTATVTRALSVLTLPAGVRVEKHIPRGGIQANFHEDSLRIVLENILNNAIESMNESGGLLTIRVLSTADDVTVEVSDTGRGMTPAVKIRAFEPHYTTKNGGLGMGLFICKSIVELQGGEIELASTEGKGTRFTVKLPRA
jgi:anti-sigma regulatory factor (Ser/Thr protein kinase)